MSASNIHILVFPYPAQGHLIPLLDLTYQLAIRGVAITILVTPKNLPLLNPLISIIPSIETLVLPFPAHPAIPPGVENVKDLPANGFRPMMCNLGRLYEPLLNWFRSHSSPPVAIISDMFLGWTQHLACQLGIRRLVFSPSGAFALSLAQTLWKEMPRRKNVADVNEIISFPQFPNSPRYPWWQLSPIYRSYVEGDPDSEFIRDGYHANLRSWGVIINTNSKLESAYLDHLMEITGHDKVWAVGPLLPSNEEPMERGGSSSTSTAEISSWLDRCEDHSVVYICFGSQAVLTNQQMDELALGLEKSGVRFIWSVKGATKGHTDSHQYGVIPPGFEDRVARNGLLVKGWAPQVMILRHRAIGAFLTHCGWNSVLEALVAGVPMLAWPMGADQFINADLLEEHNIAVTVCEGAETIPDSNELAKLLAEAISGSQIRRRRAIDMRDAALDAIKQGGSSFKNLDELVNQLTEDASKGEILNLDNQAIPT